MYHARFKGSHYAAGFNWGSLLHKNNIRLSDIHTQIITDERRKFAKDCIPIYEEYYPEILKEIQGISDGQHDSFEELTTFLFSMYCFEFTNKCSCFAFKNDEELIFARNSDFLIELEKSNMNCIYKLDNVYAFTGNTTAFVQMEDGINEYGLTIGLTFIYPKNCKAGFNAGILLRFLLEKCKTTEEAVKKIQTLPMASNHALTVCDRSGNMAVIECSPEKTSVHLSDNFVVSTNNFYLKEMQSLRNPSHIDDLRADERYENINYALKQNKHLFNIDYAKNILSGKHGFMCQFDRKNGVDTIWSVVYDVKNNKILRVEGTHYTKSLKKI